MGRIDCWKDDYQKGRAYLGSREIHKFKFQLLVRKSEGYSAYYKTERNIYKVNHKNTIWGKFEAGMIFGTNFCHSFFQTLVGPDIKPYPTSKVVEDQTVWNHFFFFSQICIFKERKHLRTGATLHSRADVFRAIFLRSLRRLRKSIRRTSRHIKEGRKHNHNGSHVWKHRGIRKRHRVRAG